VSFPSKQLPNLPFVLVALVTWEALSPATFLTAFALLSLSILQLAAVATAAFACCRLQSCVALDFDQR